jgi:hypothetical protein
MTQPQLRNLVRASNPVVNPERLLLEEREVLALYGEAMQRAGNPQMSADLLDQPVERRRDMQTQQRPTEFVTQRPTRPPRRWLVTAVAAAVVVLVIGAGALLFNNDSPEVIDPPPTTLAPTTTTLQLDPAVLEVGDALNAAATVADWGAVTALFADSATLQFISPEGPSPEVSMSDPIPEDAGLVDWNGDGAVTQLDWFLRQGAEIHVGQTTAMLACEAVDAATLVCDEAREGFVFKTEGHKVTWTLTVGDGVITNLVLDVTQSTANGSDPLEVGRYRIWIGDNYPELEGELFADPITLAITPDNLDTHHQLVAEWQAGR